MEEVVQEFVINLKKFMEEIIFKSTNRRFRKRAITQFSNINLDIKPKFKAVAILMNSDLTLQNLSSCVKQILVFKVILHLEKESQKMYGFVTMQGEGDILCDKIADALLKDNDFLIYLKTIKDLYYVEK